MADDKKISELGSLTTADPSDLLVIVDTDVSTTKHITAEDLFASSLVGEFASLQLPAGAIINEFSTDGTLAGDSDTAVPTEKAVKTYVDNAISTLSSNSISDGDSSVVVADSTAGSSVTVTIDSAVVTTYTPGGVTLTSGATINEFSTDGTLSGDSNTAVPTEQAVKTYIDNKIISTGVLNVYTVSSDSTAFNGDAVIVDTTAGDVTITLDTYPDSKIIVKKVTPDSNAVIITVTGGTVDGLPSQSITGHNESYTFVSDGLNYYVV